MTKTLFDPVQEALSIDRDTGGFAAGTRKFGEGLGSFGGILGAAAINPLLAAGLATTAGAGEASERARAGDATEEERAKASILGFGVGATELISPLRILSVFKKGLGQDATVGLVGSLKRIAQEGGVEAAQEASAGIMQNLIEQGIYNPEQGTFEGAGEQALIGGGVGGFVQGLLELAVRGRIKTNPDGSQDVDVDPEGGPTAPVTDEEAKSAELRALIDSAEGTTPEVDAAATAAAAAAPEVDTTIEGIAADIRAENAEKKAAGRDTEAARKRMEKDAAKEGVPADTAVAPEAAPEAEKGKITEEEAAEQMRTAFGFTPEQVTAGLKIKEDLDGDIITEEQAAERLLKLREEATPDQLKAELKVEEDFNEGRVTEEEAKKRINEIQTKAAPETVTAPVEDADTAKDKPVFTLGKYDEFFENMGEEGAGMEFPAVGQAVDSYVTEFDPKESFDLLDGALKSDDYPGYATVLRANLDRQFPGDKISVSRTENYSDPHAKHLSLIHI